MAVAPVAHIDKSVKWSGSIGSTSLPCQTGRTGVVCINQMTALQGKCVCITVARSVALCFYRRLNKRIAIIKPDEWLDVIGNKTSRCTLYLDKSELVPGVSCCAIGVLALVRLRCCLMVGAC